MTWPGGEDRAAAGRAGAARRVGEVAKRVEAVSFDFANTLVPVSSGSFRTVVDLVLDAVAKPCGISDRPAFLRAWAEERERQFREDVPEGREVDLAQRVARVLARVRGMDPPGASDRWDDDAALRRSERAERDLIVDRYSGAFVTAVPPPAAATALLQRLAGRGLRLAIVSNWPLAVTIERYVEAAGWARCLTAVVVSQRVGAIKPSPLVYAVAVREIGVPGSRILHVGDDWTADVVGAKRAGWLACYLRDQLPDWPRQSVDEDGGVLADLTISHLDELEAGLDRLAAGAP